MKEKLKKLAKQFDLNYNGNWFKHLWISKRENILLEYLWMCPDPIYMKYGETPFERAKQIEGFLASKDFNECLFRFGGQMLDRKVFEEKFLSWANEIENEGIKKMYLRLYEKTIKWFGSYSKLALLTKSNKKSELESLNSFVLFHEWIHVLAEENGFRPKNWKYNEGLVTYFQEFYENRLDMLETQVEKWKNYDFQKQYFIYAIKFRELLKGIKNPKKRKEKIKQYIKLK